MMRTAFGFTTSAGSAAWILFFLMMLWIAYEKIPQPAMIMIGIGVLCLFCFHIRSYTSCVVMGLFEVALLCDLLWKKGVIRPQAGNRIRWILEKTAMFSAPCAALLMIVCTFLYGRGIPGMELINKLSHGRIINPWKAIRDHGIHLFGANFHMEGAGMANDSVLTYLDSSYMNILLRFGPLALILLLLVWGWIARRASEAGHYRILIVMILVAIQSVEEEHFFEVQFNPLVILPFADFGIPEESGQAGIPDRERKIVYTPYVLTGLCLILTRIAAPYVLGILRTVIDIGKTLSGGSLNPVFTLLFSYVLLIAWILIIYGIIRHVAQDQKKKESIFQRGAVIAATGLVLACGIGVYCAFQLMRGAELYRTGLEADRAAVAVIMDAHKYPVYSARVPVLYKQTFGGFSDTIYVRDDIAKYKSATVLVDRDDEATESFLAKGFFFAEISDTTAVYTNDIAVIRALEDADYHVTGFYSAEREIPVNDQGEIRETPLNGGWYTVKLKLHISGDTSDPEAAVCQVMIDGEKGKRILSKTEISAASVDENGSVQIEPRFQTPRLRAMEIHVTPADGYEVEPLSCSYVATPSQDMHAFLDDRYQVIRREFYDLEGNPTTGDYGASAVEYEYDDNKDPVVIRLYDAEGKPFTTGNGYAELHRAYDALHRMTGESYYGPDAEPVVLSAGYAAFSRELDTFGNIVEERYYGTDGNPVRNLSGYAAVHREYNDLNRIIREEYYDPQGGRMSLEAGYSAWEREYDENGNVIEIRYYGTDDEPALHSTGYAEIHMEYDAENRVIHEEYYGLIGRRITLPPGHSAVDREFDEAGNVAMTRYLGDDNQPLMITYGYCFWRAVYNEQNKVERYAYYDTAGQPALIGGTYSVAEYTYDDAGTIIEETRYNPDGEVVEIIDRRQ
ncbi:MAG: RHS repeat protein [Lachnospiraceae bacterium]|nr:RHS repeat protein [Lachnospiraceae bacterium]